MKLNHAIYLSNQHTVFVYVPKVACTGWKNIFRYLNGAEDYLEGPKAHDRRQSGLQYLDMLPNGEALLNDTHIKKICFVRNPYTRILSAWLNKFLPKHSLPKFVAIQNEVSEYARLQLKMDPANSPSFYAFLHWIQHSGSTYVKDEHWLSQTDIVGSDISIYDFVGRFETLEKDIEHVLKLLRCDASFPPARGLLTNANSKIDMYYTPREISLVKSIYQKDFETLGYSTDIKNAV